MQVAVITLFPEYIADAIRVGVVGRAVQRGQVSVQAITPREFADDPRRTVDDRPFGGGPGMVLKVEPTRSALRAARAGLPAGSRCIYLGAEGVPLTQAKVAELAVLPGMVLLAGRYEGVDERLLSTEVDETISIGDYVLSGGELPALVVIDAVVRTLPGVLGDEESAQQDSFMTGLLDWPHYTRPEQLEDLRVPEVLIGGNHEAIRRWRLKQALGRTWLRRPDLLAAKVASGAMTAEQQSLLAEFKAEQD
ncbi:MAG: tRNA (guanosine(37)-N1)-methyltransferase TrmD [Steroidobacteraceae bacterium]